MCPGAAAAEPSAPIQVSFVVRIVPSPDWFVGVDSLDLCEGGRWKEQVVLDLYPHDAGTDSGFTFSSPNFATIPQDTVTEVSSPQSLPHGMVGQRRWSVWLRKSMRAVPGGTSGHPRL